jgi:hypothetical protein
MEDNWRPIGGVMRHMLDRLAPVTYAVPLQPSLANALDKYAAKEGKKPETIIAEATRSYLGDAA